MPAPHARLQTRITAQPSRYTPNKDQGARLSPSTGAGAKMDDRTLRSGHGVSAANTRSALRTSDHRDAEISGQPLTSHQRLASSSQCQSSCAVTTRRSEEHTSELQSLMRISSAVFCLKKHRLLTTT